MDNFYILHLCIVYYIGVCRELWFPLTTETIILLSLASNGICETNKPDNLGLLMP